MMNAEWRAEGRRQNAEGRRQKAEGRRQKAEGRRQKAEGRRQKAEGRAALLRTLHSAFIILHSTPSPWWNGDHASVRSSKSRFDSWRGQPDGRNVSRVAVGPQGHMRSLPRKCEGQHGTL